MSFSIVKFLNQRVAKHCDKLKLNRNEIGQNKGFTLIELLLTLLLLITLTSIALPSFSGTLKRWEAKEVRNQIINAFRVAKAQSFMRRQNSILCLADANFHCHNQAKEYLLIFTDSDNNHQFDPAVNKLLLKQSLNLDYGRVYLRAGRRHYIKFFGDSGLPRGHFGHIKYCSNDHLTHNTYQISLNQQGNYRFKPYSIKKTGCP